MATIRARISTHSFPCQTSMLRHSLTQERELGTFVPVATQSTVVLQ
jgi:hypothetical protein